jgi:hypothetical protein
MRRIPSPIVRTRPARPRISLSRPMARLDIPCIGRGIEASLFVPTTSSYSENSFSVLLRSSQLVLKVVGNEKGGGREPGYCSKMISDRGDRCLFTF